jgi:quercetin dioxygenase-like cupin family protein
MLRPTILLLASLSSWSAALAQEGTNVMEIKRKGEQTVVQGPEQYFTGKATIIGQFSREAPSRVTGAIVHFEPGARTAWHTHPLGQTLIVTEGVGWTQVEGEEKLEFHAGDIMLCPADKKHWHGATPREAMTHVAIQEALDGKNVTWMEKVTDEEYLSVSGAK